MIGFLTSEFPGATSHYGGIGTSIKYLSDGLRTLKIDTKILLLNDDEDATTYLDGITIYKIKRIRLPGLTACLTGLKISWVVNDLVKKGKIDVLEVPDWTGISAFVSVKCPIVMRLNGSETYFKYLEGNTAKFRYRFLENRAFSKADYLISVSQFTADLTNSIFHSQRFMEVIPNAVDAKVFSPLNTANHKPIILYFGTLVRKKGVLELPKIFARVLDNHPEAHILIIGRDNPDLILNTNSTWDLIQSQFNSYGITNVQYIPGLPRQELIKYIQSSALCVFPSYAEALPVSWLEAMSCGKAIVASDIGWASEIIEDGINGFMVHPTNHEMFAERICRLLTDINFCKQMGAAARKTVLDKFSTEVVLDKFLNYYTTILNKPVAN